MASFGGLAFFCGGLSPRLGRALRDSEPDGSYPPAGFDGKTYEKSTTDRAQIVEELNKSWEFAQNAINSMTNADFAKLLPKLGPQANAGDVVYILVGDAHEHLGQSVAYARENGIVPPWTVEAQKKAAEKKAEQK